MKHKPQKKPFYKVNFTRENNSSCSKSPKNTLKKHVFYIQSYFKSFCCFSRDAKWPHLKSTLCFNITSFLQSLNTDQLQFPSDHAAQRLKRKSGIVAVASNSEEKEVLTILPSALEHGAWGTAERNEWVDGRQKLWNYTTFGICRGEHVKAECSAPDCVIVLSCTMKSLHILLVTWSVEYMKCISQWANCVVFNSQYITQPLLLYIYIYIYKGSLKGSLKVMKNVLLATLIDCTKLSNVVTTLALFFFNLYIVHEMFLLKHFSWTFFNVTSCFTMLRKHSHNVCKMIKW